MSRVKRDIMKCNFPTKVKFMGLTEKKVMFLTKTFKLTLQGAGDRALDTHSFYLSPLDTTNISSITDEDTVTIGQQDFAAQFSNWDKLCILGIYIRFQPVRNNFNGGAQGDSISPIQCIYSMNNVEYAKAPKYDQTNLERKQVFTFNSNEAFTVYVPAPTTMETASAVVHKSKTWWSITDLFDHT